MPTRKVQTFQIRKDFSNKMRTGQKIVYSRPGSESAQSAQCDSFAGFRKKFEIDVAAEVQIGNAQFKHLSLIHI